MGDNKTPKNNLARIRDNQRRSRARRKEYLQELEAKYRACQQIGIEASAEVQAAARKVLDENKRLRTLLREKGISDTEVIAYLAASTEDLHNQNTSASLSNLLGRRIPFPEESIAPTQEWNSSGSHHFRATSQPTLSRYNSSGFQHDSRPDSPHSNPSPISISDAHSSYSTYSAHPDEYPPEAGSFPHLAYQYDIAPNSSWPMPLNVYTPQSQLGYASSLSRVSSSNMISGTHSEVGGELDTSLACTSAGTDSLIHNVATFDLMDRYQNSPYHH